MYASGIDVAEIDLLRTWASNTDYIEEVYVFGSRARGDHKSSSDLDLAVRVTPTENQTADGIGIALRSRWEKELQEFLPYCVDLQVTRPDANEKIVWPAVVREGVKLFPF